MAVAYHWVLPLARIGAPSLWTFERASWLWAHLRQAFPSALACVLMPDHVHLVTSSTNATQWNQLCGAFTKRFGDRLSRLEPQPVNTKAIARRTLRYVFHNPVRAGTVDDPWCASWSTLRELAGAAYPHWTRPEHVARVVGVRQRDLLSTLTWVPEQQPVPPQPERSAHGNFEMVVAAVTAACRVPRSVAYNHRPTRRLLAQLATHVHLPAALIATELGISARGARHLRSTTHHPAFDAARLCLADARLRMAVEQLIPNGPQVASGVGRTW